MSSPGIDTTQQLNEGALFAERYRVTRLIGKGGMGSVYEVVDERTGGVRALKLMSASTSHSSSLRARFEQEAKIASRIESEHLVRIFDVGTQGARPFIVMELLRGEDLASVIARRRLDPSEALLYLRQVSRALERTHAAHVVHRDLKPENLFLTQRDDGSGCIKILDFGVAKVVEPRGPQASHTRVVGTPLYMSPEQVEGTSEIGPRADTHALAHVAFTLLTGFPYWEEEARDGPMALLMRLLKGPVEPPTARAARRGVALPRGFDAWFARAAAVSPAERHASPREAIDALFALYGAPSEAGASLAHGGSSRGSVDPSLPTATTVYGGLASAATMVGGTPPSARGSNPGFASVTYGASPESHSGVTSIGSSPEGAPLESSPSANMGAAPVALAPPPTPAALGSSPEAYSGVMPIPLAPTFTGPPSTQTFTPEAYASSTVIGPPPAFEAGSAPPIVAGAPSPEAKPARKHSPISMIAAGACAALLAIGFVVILVLGLQRGKAKRPASASASAASASASPERVGPRRSATRLARRSASRSPRSTARSCSSTRRCWRARSTRTRSSTRSISRTPSTRGKWTRSRASSRSCSARTAE
ncbi:MAG: protein kinase [Polyangiaceae bacterium]